MKEIILTKNKVAIVDDDLYEYLNQWKWHAHRAGRKWYACRSEKVNGVKKNIYMHRFIRNTPSNMLTDHRDGDGLNNQDYNLRDCEHKQNLRNTGKHTDNLSGFKGVTVHKKTGRKRYLARIMVNYKQICIGLFYTKEDAARAYDNAATIYHGEYASLNFPEKRESE